MIFTTSTKNKHLVLLNKEEYRKKKTMKKISALIISICLLISTAAVTGSGADSNKHTGSPIPVIYLTGTGMNIVVDNEDGSTTEVFPVNLSGDRITALV